MSDPAPPPAPEPAPEPAPTSAATPSPAASPTSATPGPPPRTPGWREVLLVSAAVVLVVLGAAVVTGYLPTDVQRVVFHEPLLIGFLVLGTILVLWSVARRRPPT